MKAFIFDFDGVIVDSERQWRDKGDRIFYPSIIPGWTIADGAKMMGLGFRAGYDLLVREYGLIMPFEEYEQGLNALVDEFYIKDLHTLPGLHDLIERVEKLGLKKAIASSGGREWIHSVLKDKNLFHHFPVICSANDVGDRTKPHPDVYLLAAEKLGVDPSECIALEDSNNGIRAAKAAGMTCIALETDMSALQDLSQADLCVTHYDLLTEEVLMGF
jgi:HAD superfamily hydrolase (TIGR01509 family)